MLSFAQQLLHDKIFYLLLIVRMYVQLVHYNLIYNIVSDEYYIFVGQNN